VTDHEARQWYPGHQSIFQLSLAVSGVQRQEVQVVRVLSASLAESGVDADHHAVRLDDRQLSDAPFQPTADASSSAAVELAMRRGP